MQKQLTAIIEREGDGYVSLCPELDIASQGGSIEDARDNLREALELFFETASSAEIKQRLHEEVPILRRREARRAGALPREREDQREAEAGRAQAGNPLSPQGAVTRGWRVAGDVLHAASRQGSGKATRQSRAASRASSR